MTVRKRNGLGTVPTGPGKWLAASPPAGPQCRNGEPGCSPRLTRFGRRPPPEFGSPQFTAALAEVKNYTRSPQATENAIFWHAYGGGRNYQMWHRELGSRALEHGYAQETLRMAAAFAALSIGVRRRSYRLLGREVPVLVHPAFASRSEHHDPGSAALPPELPISAFMPVQRRGERAGRVVSGEVRQFNELTKQSGESRIAAGLHYRFDCEAGDEIGRRAAALALAKIGAGTALARLKHVHFRWMHSQRCEGNWHIRGMAADGITDGLALVRGQIVHDDDVAGLESGNEDLDDVGEEALAVDRAVEQAGRREAIVAERRDERQRLPTPVRHLIPETMAARASSPRAVPCWSWSTSRR